LCPKFTLDPLTPRTLKAFFAMKKSLKAVLFDLGGTLYDYNTGARANLESQMEALGWTGAAHDASEVLSAYKDTMRRVFQTYLPQPFYLHRDLFKDALVGLFEALDAPFDPKYYEPFRTTLMQRYKRDLHPREDAVETLRALKQRNLVLGIVSNIDDDQLDALTSMMDISPHFDFMISSESVRSCKPDPGIFQEALEAAGCRAEEALFVGDSIPQDIAGANQAGLQSVLLWHRDDSDPPEDGPQPRYRIRDLKEIIDIVDS
jgi:2-haloacid dehalogenase